MIKSASNDWKSGQIYSDNYGPDGASREWNVDNLLKYARQHHDLIELDVDELVKTNLGSSNEESTDEIPGTPEFIERANRSDLNYPVTAAKYPDGVFLIDGVHRLWKANHLGHKTIRGWLMDYSEMKNVPQIPPLTKSSAPKPERVPPPAHHDPLLKFMRGKQTITVSVLGGGKGTVQEYTSPTKAFDFAQTLIGPGIIVNVDFDWLQPSDKDFGGTWAEIRWQSFYGMPLLKQSEHYGHLGESGEKYDRFDNKMLPRKKASSGDEFSSDNKDADLYTVVRIYHPATADYAQSSKTFPDPVLALNWAKTQAGPGIEIDVSNEFFEWVLGDQEHVYKRYFRSTDGEDFKEIRSKYKWNVNSETPTEMLNLSGHLKVFANQLPSLKK